MKKITLFGVLFVFLAAANCGAVGSTIEQPKSKVTKARVMLSIFSGRPNPTWTLSAKNAEQLVTKINKLPKSDAAFSPDGLGYTGFQIELTDSESRKSKITAYKGLVVYNVNDTSYYFSDSRRSIEKLLIESGKLTLDHQLYQTVKAEIETSDN